MQPSSIERGRFIPPELKAEDIPRELEELKKSVDHWIKRVEFRLKGTRQILAEDRPYGMSEDEYRNKNAGIAKKMSRLSGIKKGLESIQKRMAAVSNIDARQLTEFENQVSEFTDIMYYDKASLEKFERQTKEYLRRRLSQKSSSQN